MRLIAQILFCSLLGYLVGGINPAYLLSKMKGFDIRSEGSGNAGASNAVIVMGKLAGVFCALFDIFKAYAAVKISIHLFPALKVAGILAGACCILGHIFPVLMQFHGGKGLAALGGVILAHNARFFLCILMVELIMVWILDYICVVPTSGSLIFALFLIVESGLIYAISFCPVVVAIFLRHRKNFRRIRYGVEARVSYLWKKTEELQRLQKNWDSLTEEQRLDFEKDGISLNHA